MQMLEGLYLSKRFLLVGDLPFMRVLSNKYCATLGQVKRISAEHLIA